jgi:hypothetical protein
MKARLAKLTAEAKGMSASKEKKAMNLINSLTKKINEYKA